MQLKNKIHCLGVLIGCMYLSNNVQSAERQPSALQRLIIQRYLSQQGLIADTDLAGGLKKTKEQDGKDRLSVAMVKEIRLKEGYEFEGLVTTIFLSNAEYEYPGTLASATTEPLRAALLQELDRHRTWWFIAWLKGNYTEKFTLDTGTTCHAPVRHKGFDPEKRFAVKCRTHITSQELAASKPCK
jgi:hypothetical protein